MGRFSEIIEKSEFTAPPDTSKNPDQFAADQDLAGQTGLPVDYVERNRAEAEKVKKQNVDYSKFADMELGASLTDPAFSNLAQDDLDNLSYLEKTFKGLGTTISESFKQGAKGVALSAYESNAGPGGSAGVMGITGSEYDYLYEERHPGFMADVRKAAAGIAIESMQQNEEAIKAATPEGLDVLQKGIRSGVQSLSQMAPGFAASLATRSSAPMLSIAGVQSYGSAYAKARQEGYAPEQAASYGMIDAAVEVATEKLPADKLLKITGEFGNQTLKNVVKFMVTEAGTEQVATFLQSLNAQLFGLDEELAAADTAAEQAKIHAERAAVTLVATVVAGGSQAGIAVGVGKAADKLSGNKQQLQDMVASAEQSNLKRRSPEQFRSFLQSVDPLANIFIPASAFEGVQLDPSNKTLAQVAAQLPQARALNGDIVVPVADVLTDIPADMFAQVAPFVRVEADGVAEIEGRPDMKELIEQVNRESEMAVQSKAFSDDLASQLVATARARPEEAKKYAAVVSARLETLAVDKGMTFDEAKAKYIGELRVVGPEGEIGAGDVLAQSSQRFSESNRLGNLAFDGPSWERLRENNPALAGVKSADEEITIYRATVGDTIRPDDFVAVDRSVAEMELENVIERDGDAKIIEQTVKVGDLLMGNDATEFVYFPQSVKKNAADIQQEIRAKYEGVSLSLIESGNSVELSKIVVPEDLRDSGTGTAVMKDLIAWADDSGKTITLDPSADFGGSKKRLVDFYKRFGFVENKGKSKEYEISRAMYRKPSKKSPSFVESADQIETDDPVLSVMAEELLENGASVTADGRVQVFHRTTPEAAAAIKSTGKMSGKENRLFFSTVRDGQNAGYGDAVVELLMPINKLQLDDSFGDEAHLSLKTKKAGDVVDVSQYVAGQSKQFAQSVYHGTPHRFDRFSLSAMGTGEGAQAYGWGLYFAGKRGVAEWYRDTITQKIGSPADKLVEQMGVPRNDDSLNFAKLVIEHNGNVKEAIAGFDKFAKFLEREGELRAFSKMSKFSEFVKNKFAGVDIIEIPDAGAGVLYQTDIPEDSELLDWDKPLSEQPAMMERLKVKQKAAYLHNELSPEMTGQQAVDRLARGLTNRGVTGKQQASEYLDSLGIPGLRYLDATARGKEVESHNYVIWDENRITIEAINDELRQAKEFAQTAFHGSPFKFDKFTLDNIGTGEGGASHGFGLYFSSRHDVADWYRETVSKGGGKTYSASIPEDDELLVWEATLSEQSPYIRKALLASGYSDSASGMTGKELYQDTEDAEGSARKATELFLSNGIKGIKYIGGSGGAVNAPMRVTNYVIFDSNAIKIVDDINNDRLLSQKERGLISISDKEIVIKLTEASNRSTFIHEAGHLFLEIESRIAAQDGISDGQRKMLDWLGVKSFEEIGVDQHEQFARGFEAYAMEGRAPSKDLVEVFRSFARWLKKVYASMRDLDVELNDDIRQFFDRMLAADQAIKEAERLTQYKALFKDAKTAGMTEQEFADYAANQVRAQVKGGEELQSKLLKELTRQTEKWWKEELAAEKEKAAESLGKEKLYQATAFLTGKTKIEGFDVHKMDLEAVKAMLGVEKKKPEKRYRPETYVDPRLKRENYRGFLDALVNRDLLSVKEGNLALVVDNTQKGESDSGETKYKRTSSVNPEWFQQFNKENTPVSVDQARIIVKKALAGDRLGVNQARFVVAALDEITGKRSDYADTLRRQREFIREERKRIAEDMPVPEDWISYDEIAKSGEVYKPDQYLADADYIDRSLSEIGYSAILNGVDESVVFDIIDTKSTIEAIESIQKLLKEKADEQGYITQASTGERSNQGMAEEEAGKGGKQREKTGLEKFRGMLAKGGLSPDEVAAMFDFASGQDLVDTIANSPTFNEATAAAAKQAMIDKHGDILNDGTLQQEAQLAAHNEERGKLILAELRALTRKVGKEAINRDALKFSAKEVIGRTPLKDIHPGKYRTAEVRSAKEAATALAKKDYAAAAQAKLKQAANFYLYREAMDAKQKEQSWRRYLSAVPNRKYSAKDVHPDYFEQMRLLAAVYDFRRSPDPATLSGIGVWIKAQQEAKDVDIAPTVMDVNLSRAMEATAKGEPVQVKNYREMTLDELQGVYDMVKHLRWVGGQLSENEKVKRQQTYEKAASAIEENSKRTVNRPRQSGGTIQSSKEMIAEYKADYFPFPDLIEQLDGFKEFGAAFNLMHQPVIDSTNKELRMRRDTATKAKEVFKAFSGKFFTTNKDEFGSYFTPGKGEATITTDAGDKFTLDRRGRLMVALYNGSQYSRDVLMQGDNLTINDINKILAPMTNKELDLVESIWEINESFWPETAAVSKEMTGIVPTKREIIPFVVNGRVMKGGYMKLAYMYDTRDSHASASSEDGKITRTGDSIVTQTKHGARMEVVGSGGRKVALEISTIFKAWDEAIHDIAFAKTARDTMSALRSKEISGAIERHYGKEVYESMLSSLSGIIAGNASANSGGFYNRMVRHFRTASTYSMLGYSIRNLVQQPAALPNIMNEVGIMDMTAEMVKFWAGGNWNNYVKNIQSKSEFMMQRASLVNRDTAAIMAQITDNVMSNRLKAHAFDLQTLGDAVIAYPGWMVAYKKALARYEDDPVDLREKKAVTIADETIAKTIGSGLMKDLSPMLQGGGRLGKQMGAETLKSITFMGSYMAVVGRMIARAKNRNDYRTVRGAVKMSREMAMVIAFPAVLSALFVGSVPDEDDDETWAGWFFENCIKYGLSTAFVIRDLMQVVSGYDVQNSYGRAAESLVRGFGIGLDIAQGEKEITDLETQAKLLRAAGNVVPLPVSYQGARTMEYIDSQQDGNEGEFNIFKMLVVGKDRD